MTTKDLTHDDRYSNQYINLADKRLGTEVLYATDDFFAEKENLINSGRGVFIADKYTDRGKWMDGWESRRKRTEGHDYCDIKLGLRGTIFALDIDTNHFLGNHPPFASVEACDSNTNPDSSTRWVEVLPQSELKPGSQNFFEIKVKDPFTHVRLHIYPDGGVARFRAYGDVKVNWDLKPKSDLIDLVAVENGGKSLSCNDMFFSSKDNLIMPNRGTNMGDGWETKRRRTPGNDWVILQLGAKGTLSKVVLDTAHFKGNYPDRFDLYAGDFKDSKKIEATDNQWKLLLPEQKLSADHIHTYENELKNLGPITHVKMNIYPDGGVSRLRLFGHRV